LILNFSKSKFSNFRFVIAVESGGFLAANDSVFGLLLQEKLKIIRRINMFFIFILSVLLLGYTMFLN